MSVHRVLLLLLPLPCMCLLTNSTARLVGSRPTDSVDDCDTSYCAQNLITECNKVFLKDNSTCVYLNCSNDTSCERLLEKIGRDGGPSQASVAKPLPTSASSPHALMTVPPAPGPPPDAARDPDPEDPDPQQPSSSGNSTSLNPPNSSDTNSSSANGQINPNINPVAPPIKKVLAPTASLKPETTSVVDEVHPGTPSSDGVPAAGANKNKTATEISTTPELPTTAPATTQATTNASTAPPPTTPTMTTTVTMTTATTPSTTTVKVTTTIPAPTTTKSSTVPKPAPSTAATTSQTPLLPSTHPVTPAGGQNPSPTTPKPPENPSVGQVPNTESKEKEQPGQAVVVEAAGEPLTIHVVNTSSLLAVLMFGLLFFIITVILFLRHAYESYKRKDYTQVDYLINGMYSDSGV
ncbi:uncharacterized protein C11orf24 [Colossoma macropomum]|uniref:uncharacterized protein C11orf24 n=1 Tax=Colossoma macropomum TaxID=42526 RepID=UPI00186531F4|nr:uncharacterized protein C11orf24 [Colossoma macropomum]XP_036423925.1 uncharacterized protein C11orf24 [Colossoma macropomum]